MKRSSWRADISMNHSTNNTVQDNSANSKAVLIFWCATFGVVAIAIVFSNVLTISGFLRMRCHSNKKRNGHLFLLNLAVSDLLVGVVAVPMYIYMLGSGIWVSTHDIRAIFRFLDIVLGLASVFSITAVSLERFVAVKWPVLYRVLKMRYYITAIALTWISAGTMAVLNVLNLLGKVTQMLFICIAVAAPLVITAASYIGVWKMKRRSRSLSQRRPIGPDEDAEFGRTLLIVTVVFYLTWSPFLILNVIVMYCMTSPCQVLVIPFKLLQYGNSCADSVIYVLRFPAFRRAIKDVLRAGCRCSSKMDEVI